MNRALRVLASILDPEQWVLLGNWLKPSRRLLTRVIALLVTVTFVWPYLTWAFEAEAYSTLKHGVVFQGKVVEIPERFGTVEKFYPGNEQLLIHVQDLHCNFEVQNNIANIIDYLAREHQLTTVGIEGASKPVNVTHLATYPNERVRQAAGKHFMQQGKMSGAEYYAGAGSRPIFLDGIEQADAYAASRRMVMGFLNDESQGLLYDLRELLDELKDELYNPELLAIDAKKRSYRDGEMPLVKYGAFLVGQAQALKLDLQTVPHLAKYVSLRQNVIPQELNPDKIFEETDRLDADIRQRLYSSPDQRKLDELLQRLDLMEKLLNISATPEELARFQSQPELFRVKPFAEFIQTFDQLRDLLVDTDLYALDQYLQQVMAFYRLADERSQAFVQNAQKRMTVHHSTLALIVTGGFHTERVMEAARAQGMTCLTVRPRLSQQDLVNPYFALIRERRTPLEKLLAENQNILALAPNFPQVGDNERNSILTAEQEASLPETIRLFLTPLRMVLLAEEVAQSAAEGIGQLPALEAVLQKAQDQYPYAEGVAIDWKNALAAGNTFILPYVKFGLSAVIQPVNALTQAGGVELMRLERDGVTYAIRMFDNQTVARLQDQMLASGQVTAARGQEARVALLRLISPVAVMTAGGALAVAGQPTGAFGNLGTFAAAAPNWLRNFRNNAQTSLNRWQDGLRRVVVDEQGRLTPAFRLLAGAAMLSLGIGLTLLAGVPAVVSLGIAGVGIAALNYGALARAYQANLQPVVSRLLRGEQSPWQMLSQFDPRRAARGILTNPAARWALIGLIGLALVPVMIVALNNATLVPDLAIPHLDGILAVAPMAVFGGLRAQGGLTPEQQTEALRAQTNELAWSVRQAANDEAFRQILDRLAARLADIDNPRQGAAILTSVLAAAYQNPRLTSSAVWPYVMANQALSERFRLYGEGFTTSVMPRTVAFIARATVDETVGDQLAQEPAEVNFRLLSILSNPALVLFSFDPAQATAEGQIARQRRVTEFYQTLEGLRTAEERRAHMRAHLDDATLFDQKTVTELHGQRVLSKLMYGVSRSDVKLAGVQAEGAKAGASYWYRAAGKNVESMVALSRVTEPTTVYMGFAV
ncbi:MAG: hypothetical protein AB1439_12830, partial [candidate division FCPU426 bacterium]